MVWLTDIRFSGTHRRAVDRNTQMAIDQGQRPTALVRGRATRFIGRKIPDRATYHDVIAQIGGAIQAGELRLGDRLPSERALSDQLDVSRATVRKACQALADAGVLEIRSALGPSSGMYVSSEVLPAGIAGAAEPLPLDEIARVLEARRLFEPRVAQLAGYLATKSDLAELEQIIEAQRQVADDPMLVRGLDASFHLAIARATHNATIVALMQTLQQRLQLARNPIAMPDEVPLTIEMHERTLAAISTHDPDLIEVAMLDHLGMLEEAWKLQAAEVLPRRAPDFLQALGA
jgi:GntR family transcriptional regulator, transcriptional repressor for pyruvate dehydrogenase complex